MVDRISHLRCSLPDEKSAFIIQSDVNRFYYSGFRSSAGFVVITNDSATLLVDFRYYEAATKVVDKSISVVCFRKAFESINEILKKENVSKVYIEKDFITLSEYSLMKENLCADISDDFDLSKTVLLQRSIKSDIEIDKIITAQKIAERSYLEVLNFVKKGVSEREIAVELEYLMKKYGAEKVAFDLIVVSGAKSSLPHGVPDDKVINAGDFITFDIGAVYEGYHSDMTRTVALSYATDEMKQVYDIVLNAHLEAEKVICAGNTCADVDNAARDYIISKGYGDYFGHSTGHGVGLEIHENPTVYKTNTTPLKNGMVITDEPGIYLPEKFGVRIEDMFLVQKDGSKSLANIDKELIIL